MAVIPDGGFQPAPTPDDGWRKSSYSGARGDCVEVNETAVAGAVFLRDTRHRDLATLAFPGLEWSAFLNGTVRIWAR
ncbi:DUF397 domain-containing protein [Nocardiopsis sp. CA-288880]|uniref:DUF397 domain-containing protein n=1 Tax=Nocardiopsis sp. CA-288880 TaxID=3239995 RepID=UPI003D95D9F6